MLLGPNSHLQLQSGLNSFWFFLRKLESKYFEMLNMEKHLLISMKLFISSLMQIQAQLREAQNLD